jgi:hypothetical protein
MMEHASDVTLTTSGVAPGAEHRQLYGRVVEPRVVRVGNVVRRPLYPWSTSVHELLRHLQSVGFPAPRVVDVERDVEVLTWIEGKSGSAGWAHIVREEGLAQWERFLRTYHDAVATYRPAASSVWSGGTGSVSIGDIVCHGDFGPWNAVWRNGQVVGLIDWDHARPAPPLFDISYGLEYEVPFRNDAHCVEWLAYPAPPDRVRRIEVFCAAYGIDAPRPASPIVARQQRTTMEISEELARRGLEPQATWFRQGYGDELRARIAWTESSGL